MRHRVLILGGYGTFGRRISRELAQERDIHVLIAGRDLHRGQTLVRELDGTIPEASVEAIGCDITDVDFAQTLRKLAVAAVVNTCGPFQHRDYHLAEDCIRAGIHYVDLADAREYVAGFSTLDALAKQHGVLAVTGASTVPALAAAVIDHLASDLALRSIDYGISPGNRTPRGLATVRSILSYCGKPFLQWRDGRWIEVHGWQGLRRRLYPTPMGKRWLSYCNVPDLSLFPARYPQARDVVFRAGLELSLLHLGTWLLSWLARAHLVADWSRYAAVLLRVSEWLERGGSDVGGMHVSVVGTDANRRTVRRTWQLIARSGDGPQVPCTPSVVLTKKLLRGETACQGAMPCLGLLTLDELRQALVPFAVQVIEEHETIGLATAVDAGKST